jgi:ABC-type glycerol-3-phosphate transport system substrate-binding protein
MAGILALALAGAGGAHADCTYKNGTPLKSITAGFEAWKTVTAAMAQCGDVTSELDQEFEAKLAAALSSKPALYQLVGLANDSIVGPLNAGTIRPLDDLVAKYGKALSPNQIIKLNGHVYVIGIDVNDQTLLYRKDILEKLNIPVPTTWDDVIAAAEKIRASGTMQYPLGATMKAGWNLALDFVNMYLGYGGDFFASGNEPALNNATGVKALETMKRLTAYMDPNYLAADSTVVQQQFQQGKIALANLWASRFGAMEDASQSTVVGKMASAAAPTATPGGKPATTLWWDGLSIASNATEAQADAAMQVIAGVMNPSTIAAHMNDVIWLLPGYQPQPLVDGAIKSFQSGAPNYPSSTRMSLIHTAIGNNIGNYFLGKATAEQALAAAEASYRTAARDAGLLK